jgi:hypothetical protein
MTMTEETWHEARLIPTSGISGADEQERRATSALLAVVSSVKEFGRALNGPLGAGSGAVRCFIEVPFLLDGKRCFPDGLIRVSRGTKTWTCLVEVKTGTNVLETAQLENYLDIAREQGFDALLTISNEIPPAAGQHPTKVDKRKLKKVALHHLSWSQVLAEAVMQKEHRGVADPDQAWILGELIRYLEHPRSGALEFDDMGASWVPVRDAVAAGTLRATDKGAPDVAARFDALLRYASLRLGRQLGTEVTPVLSRKELADPGVRTQALVSSLANGGLLSGAIRIPNTVGALNVTLDLRAGRVSCHVDLDAPKDGRPATRVNWVVRQMKNAPDTVRVEAFEAFARGAGAAELLRDVRADATLLLQDPKKEIKTFRLALTTPLGPKRGRGRGGAIDSVLDAVDGFYADVLGQLKAWTAAPPKLREEAIVEPLPPVEEELVSTSLSSQDGPAPTETGAGIEPSPSDREAVLAQPSVAAVESGDAAGSEAEMGAAETDEAPKAWREYHEETSPTESIPARTEPQPRDD